MQNISRFQSAAQLDAANTLSEFFCGDDSQFHAHNPFQYLLPANHLVRVLDDLVEKEFDVSEFVGRETIRCGRGRPSYNRVVLLKVVLYGYMTGLHSSRKLAKACIERVDFRYLTGGLTPSFSTITKFRARYSEALAALFTQSLSMATRDDLVEMRDVAFDGTKVLANASKHKAMSYARMCEKVQSLHEDIEALKLERRTARASRQTEIDFDLIFMRERIANLQEQKFALEDERMRELGEQPQAKDQRNFTDPESRIMKKGAGFEQCYNAQAAVDKANQIIVAAYATQAGNDKQQLMPLVLLTAKNAGVLPDRGLADAGYFSEAAISSIKQLNPSTQWFVSPGRLAHGRKYAAPKGRIPKGMSVADLMRRKLNTKAGKAAYAQRKAIVEPAFGQIKEASLEFRRFSFRGLVKVQNEWLLVCAAHNLLKMIRRRSERNAKLLRANDQAA